MVKKSLASSAVQYIYFFVALLLISSCSPQKEKPEEATKEVNSSTSGFSNSSQNSSHGNKDNVSFTDTKEITKGAEDVSGSSALPVLSYRVRPGETFSYKVTQHNRLREGSMRSEDSTVYFYTKRITSVIPDSMVEFTLRFDKIEIHTTIPVPDSTGKPVYRTLHYNSALAADQKNPDFQRYTALIGQKATMKVTPRGEILDITGLEPIADKLLNSLKDSLTAEQRTFVMREVAVNAYAMIHKQEFQVYPEKPLDSTRTWKASYPAPLAGLFPTENTVTYKLENVLMRKNRQVAQITATLHSKVLEKKRANEHGSIVLDNGGLSGGSEHLVDLQEGYTIFKKYNLTVNMEVSATDNKTKQKQTTKQQTSSDITVELL